MNKYRKAESRRVKAFVKSCGGQYTYKKVRRIIRAWDRDIRMLPKVIMRGLRKGFRRIDHAVVEATKNMAQFGIQASIYLIDETPIEATPTQWPKENPHFEMRRLGKFIYKEESE